MKSSLVDVAILGAGAAGLRAAQVLLDHDNDADKLNVVVLEARSVAGGRIRWTDFPAGSHDKGGDNKALYIDEGAQFLHGVSRKNPIVRIAQKEKIYYRKVDWDDGYLFVGPNQKELPRKLERKEEKIVEKIESQLRQWQKNQAKLKISSTVDQKDASLESVLKPLIAEHCNKDSSLSPQRMWAYFRMEIADDYATDLHTLSARYFDQDDVFGNIDAVPHNYQNIVQAMLPKHDCVKYQHVVENLNFADDDAVRIICRRSDTDEAVEIKARKVICALPLGVLKQQSTALFDPCLPERLQQSIQRLGYGCLEKVWLHFTCPPFWPTDVDAFYHAASETPYRTWFLPARVYRNPAYERTLCCFVSGAAARALARLSSDQVAAQALAALREIMTVPSDDATTLVQHVHVTQWSTDPWSGHGSYSHLAVGSTPEDYRAWEGSFYQERLWFAGEGTSVHYPSTVHGAYLSGERAARACLQSLK